MSAAWRTPSGTLCHKRLFHKRRIRPDARSDPHVVLWRRLQILADGQKIDISGAHISITCMHGLRSSPKTNHDPDLVNIDRVQFLDPLQQPQEWK